MKRPGASASNYIACPQGLHVSAVVVFAGILFWGWLWATWGLLLGMPTMMAIKSVCDHVEQFKPVGEFMGD